MIHLLDDSLSSNGQNAYVNVPTYDSCARCDPQQDWIPSNCPGTAMMSIAGYASGADVSRQLSELVGFLEKLDFRKDQVNLGKLAEQATTLTGKFPALSQLQVLQNDLATSTEALNGLLATKTAAHKTDASAPSLENLTVAVGKEAVLNHTIDYVMYSGTSGKDCRAAEMLIK